jgi:hypothetical protein
MPPLEQQQKAIEVFEKLKLVKQHHTATAPHLEALLPSILDKAFKGEL